MDIKEHAEAVGNLAFLAFFTVVFTAVYALEEWLWRRRTKQTIRKMMRWL